MPQVRGHEWATRSELATRDEIVMNGAAMIDDRATRPPKMVVPPAKPAALYSVFGLAYLAGMDYSQIITMEPGKRSGKPCIRGTRMTVGDVLDYLAAGMTHAEVLHDFPNLTEQDILACLSFAADRERKVELVIA